MAEHAGAVRRREDPRLITGAGEFVDDLRVPGCLHAAMLRSPHAHARIRAIDVAAARRLPGVVGVYAVGNSVVDVWIMLGMGVLGYVLRKLDFETAPIVLGLVLAPMMELSLRQSLAMSAGSYAIFVTRPISVILLAIGLVLVVLALRPLVSRTLDWRSRLAVDT